MAFVLALGFDFTLVLAFTFLGSGALLIIFIQSLKDNFPGSTSFGIL